SKKRKDEELSLALDLVRALGVKGGDDAKRALGTALAAQKPKEWLTAVVAIQLLNLGDAAGKSTVEAALAKKDWPGTQIDAAVALGRSGDLAGLPVLEQMMKSPSLGKSLANLALGRAPSDPESMRMAVADA